MFSDEIDYIIREYDYDDIQKIMKLRFSYLFIQGAEVTQAIQYYRSHRHLTDANDRGPDNSVTLIAGKPAWVRVYVRSNFLIRALGGDGSYTIDDVTGTIEIERRVTGDLYQHVVSLSPEPPGKVSAHNTADYVTERSTLTDTLNFVIPAEDMCGHLRLRIHISAPGGHEDALTLNLNVTLQQTLSMRGVMVSYNGPPSHTPPPGTPNLNLAAPTLADLQATSAWTLLAFPVQSAATYGNAGTITWNQPLVDGPPTNWSTLLAAVHAQRVADGNRANVLYYGLLPAGIPRQSINGISGGGTSASYDGDQEVMAEELGHACGLSHAPCGSPANIDPNYPAYEPYDSPGNRRATLGEYGLDINTGQIKAPGTSRDVMSYCGPEWISLYHYDKLVNNADLNPAWVCEGLFTWWIDEIEWEEYEIPWPPDPIPVMGRRRIMVKPQPVISIIGVMHEEDLVEVTSIMRLDAVPQVRQGLKTDLAVELVGDGEEILDRVPVYRLPSHDFCDCGREGDDPLSAYPYVFQAFLSDVAPGVMLRILRGDDDLWRRVAPKHEPRLEGFRGGVERGELLIEWGVTAARREDVECWLQWSEDEGETWQGLTTGLRQVDAVRLDLNALNLPGGGIWVRLLASDGFHTTISEPVEVEIPERPPTITIMSPRNGQRLLAGGSLRLWGIVSAVDGSSLEVDDAYWLLNDQLVGHGLDVMSVVPEPGEYSLTLVVAVGEEHFHATINFLSVSITPPESRNR